MGVEGLRPESLSNHQARAQRCSSHGGGGDSYIALVRRLPHLCGTLAFMAMKHRRLQAILPLLALLVLLVSTGSGDAIPPKQALTAPHQYNLVSWEARQVPLKWWRQLLDLIPGHSLSQEERREAIDEYFVLVKRVQPLHAELEEALALPIEARSRPAEEVQAELDGLQRRMGRLQPVVEEALEGEVSATLDELGISGKLGPVRWPPVDFTFEASPLLLIASPRNEVRRLDDVLLRPELGLLTQEELEEAVEATDDISTLVVPTGGIGTYPAHVSPTAAFHDALFLVSHEWLHHYLFFRPLGIRIFSGGDITSINETVANIAGQEIGDQLFTRLTGETVERPSYLPPFFRVPEEPREPGTFDFTREMRQTRLRLEELLAKGLVEEAEAYLEERRQLFVENGSHIRKLNTAYFAFHGTYADSPASISPIEPQLRAIRASSEDLTGFLNRVASITSAQQLEEMAVAAGWVDTP